MRSRLLIALIAGQMLFAAGAEDLFQVIRNNQLPELRHLIANKSAVNLRGDRAVTPLLYAAAYGSPEAVKLLLQAGADPLAKNAFGATALIWGINSPEKVALLLRKGADVNARTRLGKTALLVAAHQDGSEGVVRMLLAKGADISSRDNALGLTPLLAATQANNTAVARLLVSRGADVNAADNAGFTPLMNAAGGGNIELVELLLAKGANVNAVSGKEFEKTKNGALELGLFTPLLLAATYGPPQVVRALLAAGADVNARDVRNMTPLMLSVTSEHQNPEIVRLLIAAGADRSIKSNRNETVEDWARKFRKPETLKVLGIATDARLADVALPEGPVADRNERIAKSIALLQKTNPSFFSNGGGCIACHQQGAAVPVVGLARDLRFAVDETAAATEIRTARAVWLGQIEGLLQRIDPPGGEDMLNAPLSAFAAMRYPSDKITDALVFDLAAMQRKDGAWLRSGIARSPSADSTISRTVMSLRSLQLYAPPGRKAEFDARIRRAAAWLQEARPIYNEEYAMLLLGLKWTGADRAKIARFTNTLLGQQRENGGWASNPYLPADAYATGQTLYALNQAAGISAKESAAFRRGLAFLERTQQPDGSWHVASRSPKFQPYFQSGFPHDHDQWISTMATAWATRALLLDIENPKRASR